MLNLLVVMRLKFLLAILLVTLSALSSGEISHAQTEASGGPEINAPIGGAALQGLVQVTVSSAQGDYPQAELSFGYSSDPDGTWFLIWEGEQLPADGELALWDTTTITDGDYDLRLLVTNEQGEQFESIVRGLRVRNYTAVETRTPSPAEVATATPTSTSLPPPTSTALPPGVALDNIPTNPASLGLERIQSTIMRAGLIVLAVFLIAGLYGFIRLRLRSRV